MRLLVSGSTMPSFQPFKRLILLGDEVGFMDRPSVTFGNHGSIGRDSNIRRFGREGLPVVALTAHEPKSGPAEHLYAPYVEADLANPGSGVWYLTQCGRTISPLASFSHWPNTARR